MSTLGERCTEKEPPDGWLCTQWEYNHDPDEHWTRITATSSPVGWLEMARWPVKND